MVDPSAPSRHNNVLLLSSRLTLREWGVVVRQLYLYLWCVWLNA